MNDLQRTKEWHLARQGKVTASECYLLLKNHKEDMTEEELAAFKLENPKSRAKTKEVPFSDMTFTYLDKKIAEYYMTENAYLEYIELSEPHSKALDWGTTFEEDARKRYCMETGAEIEDAPFIPFVGCENFAGGSPDGINTEDNSIIEIKCPFNPAIHLRHFLYTSAEDLLADNEQYYAQCQMNMLCQEKASGKPCPHAVFISYDPRVSVDIQIRYITIPKDEAYQQNLIDRIHIAVEYYRERMIAMQKNKALQEGSEE